MHFEFDFVFKNYLAKLFCKREIAKKIPGFFYYQSKKRRLMALLAKVNLNS